MSLVGQAGASATEAGGTFPSLISSSRGFFNRLDVLSEVRFAAFLVDLGYNPVLDEGCRQGKPDALIISEGKEILIDVVFPHLSDEIGNSHSLHR